MKTVLTMICMLGIALAIPRTSLAAQGNNQTTAQREAQAKLLEDANTTIELFKKTDPKMTRLFSESAGYAVFPTVGKGGAVFGGAHGRGVVYAKGKQIGWVTMTQFTFGAQLGGQTFSEVIFLETQDNLNAFAASQWTMNAQVNAVAAAEGAAANAKYTQGVLVFTLAKNGLMFEASVGGQKFKFTPVRKVPLY